MFFSPDIIMNIICILSGIGLFFQIKPPLYIKLLPIFLLLTFTVEGISNYLTEHKIANIPLYNFYSVLEIGFYLFVLKEIMQSRKIRKIIRNLIWIYPLIALVNILFLQKIGHFHSMTYSLGCLLIVFMSIYYFYELFQIKQSVNLIREPSFWICTGLLFFYSCTFPLFGLVNFLIGAPRFIDQNLYYILMIMNVLLYSLFTIAILCRTNIRKSML